MIYFALLLAEIFILFKLSGSMSKTLSQFMSINFLSLIFLPGVIIHELSHFFVAAILFVPVGDMEFIPKKSENGIKLGSIEIGKTDPIRRSIIGFAPVFMGLMIIIGAVYLFTSNITFLKEREIYIFLASILGIAYLLFAISNTMFSSKRDMEGTIEILITLFIILGVSYILGFRLDITHLNNILTKELIDAVQKSTLFLLAPIAIDLVILGLIRVIYERR